MHLPLYHTPLKTVNSLQGYQMTYHHSILPYWSTHCILSRYMIVKDKYTKSRFFHRIFESTSIHMPVVKIGIRLTK